MSKKKTLKLILSIILVLLVLFCIGLFIYEITVGGADPMEKLPRFVITLLICFISLFKVNYRDYSVRASLNFYDKEYKELERAFISSPKDKKTLLRAVRLYNENKLEKALKLLNSLKSVANTKDDVLAVGLFIGLSFTDMKLYDYAIYNYNQLVDMGINSSTIYNNLGHLYMTLGKHEDAFRVLRLSVQNDEKNETAWNNLAQMCFRDHHFEEAKSCALKALEINQKFRQSASLLAIIYSLEDNGTLAEKYSHIAVAAGEDPRNLKAVIERYRSAKEEDPNSEENLEPCEDDSLEEGD